MSIFESLESLNVSEECFDDIIGIVEELLGESTNDIIEKKWKEARDAGNKEEADKWKKRSDEFRKNEVAKKVQKSNEGIKRGVVSGSPSPYYTGHQTKESKKYFPKNLRDEGSCINPDKTQHWSLKREGYQRPSTKKEAGDIKTDERRYRKQEVTHYLGDEPMYTSSYDTLTAYDRGYDPKSKSQEQRTKEKLEKRKNK